MSLTKSDLTAISKVVDERLDVKLEEKLEQKLEEKLKPIRKEVNKIPALQKDIKKIRRDLKITIDHFDHADIAYEKRLDKLEAHTTHPPISA